MGELEVSGGGGWNVVAVQQSSFDSSCISDTGQEGTTLSQQAPNPTTCLLQTRCFAKQLFPSLLGCLVLGCGNQIDVLPQASITQSGT